MVYIYYMILIILIIN